MLIFLITRMDYNIFFLGFSRNTQRFHLIFFIGTGRPVPYTIYFLYSSFFYYFSFVFLRVLRGKICLFLIATQSDWPVPTILTIFSLRPQSSLRDVFFSLFLFSIVPLYGFGGVASLAQGSKHCEFF